MSVHTQRKPALALWLVLLTLAEALVLGAACDCNSIPLTVNRVCGVDGQMYQNPCIASCAGVAIGPDVSACSSDGRPFLFTTGGLGPAGAESGGPAAAVNGRVVSAYKDQGFNYLGRIKLSNDGVGAAPELAQGEEPARDANGNWVVKSLRCTSEGDVYAGSLTIPADALDLEPLDPSTVTPLDLLKSLGIEGPFLSSDTPAAADEPAQAVPEQQQEKQEQPQQLQPLTLESAMLTPEPAAAESAAADVAASEDLSMVRWIDASSLVAPAKEAEKGAAGKDAALQPADGASKAPGAQPGRRLLAQHTSSSSARLGSAAHSSRASTTAGSSSSSSGSSSSGSSGSSSGRSSISSFRRQLKALIGPDNRAKCAVRKWPFTAVGQIEVTDDNGMFVCSGTLIKPDKVLTAAHCVWNVKRNTWYKNLNFAPGRYNLNGRVVNPFGVIGWRDVTTFDAFKKNPATWDLAVVTLRLPVGLAAGTMGLSAGCMRNAPLIISGYAQDKQPGSCLEAKCSMPYVNCKTEVNPHFCDTSSGMSGAPLYDNAKKVRMLHVAGVAGKPMNQGTTITQFVLNTVMRW